MVTHCSTGLPLGSDRSANNTSMVPIRYACSGGRCEKGGRKKGCWGQQRPQGKQHCQQGAEQVCLIMGGERQRR